MSKLDPKKLAKNFHERNRRFLALGVQEQRLKIVKDVLSLLETKKIVARSDYTYLQIENPIIDLCRNTNNQVHTVLEQHKCTVCGIGSVFVSTVLLKNKIKIKNLVHQDLDDISKGEMIGYLKKWFDSNQLDLIEIAFEAKSERMDHYYHDNERLEAALKFGRKYRSDNSRLKAICKNILDNKGQFVP